MPGLRNPRNESINRSGTRGARANERDKGQDQDTKKNEQNHTTCLFIPENRLHIIPFYDFYKIREYARSRPEFKTLRD